MTKYLYHKRKKMFTKTPQYIYQRRNGWFEIRKRVGGTIVYWGSFPTIEEAELHKAYYIGKNWKVKPRFKANKHIIQRGDKYVLIKSIDGERTIYGTFDNIEDARHERDVCMKCNWDFDLIVEYED